MGMYMYVSEQDRITKRKVEDKEVNEELQEALKYDPSIMIVQNNQTIRKGLFKKETVPFFEVYHETPARDGFAYQARHQISGSGNRRIVIAYLHGIINGHVNQV